MVSFEDVKHITAEEYFQGSEFQVRTLNEKYAFTKANGEKETPAEIWWRIASELASMEETEDLQVKWRDIWFSDLYEGYYRPGGSITAGIGAHKFSGEKSSLSNCVTISFGGDSLDDIFTTFKRAAKNGSRRQGQGLDFSKLRPANAKVGNAARYSDGPVSWMKLFDSLANYIGQHNRRLALLFSLKVDHPDIELFLKCKDDIDSINNANISVVVDGRFIEAVEKDEDWTMSFDVPEHGQTITKTIKAKKLMRMIAEHAWKTGEPGWQSHELMNKWANSPYITNKRTGKKYEIVGTNASFVEGTLVSTRGGYFPIESLVGKTVSVWDGVEWEVVNNFRITGTDKPILSITLYDGTILKCTYDHVFIKEEGSSVLAGDLNIGDVLKAVNISDKIEGTIIEKGAYVKGFLVGDGHLTKSVKHPCLYLYKPKYVCKDRILRSLKELEPSSISKCHPFREPSFSSSYGDDDGEYAYLSGLHSYTNELEAYCSDYKKRLPSDIYNWDRRSKTEFIAGVFDADGCCPSNKGKRYNYGIVSIYHEWLLDLQILLKTLGVSSRVFLSNPELDKGFNNSKISWKLYVSKSDAVKLSQLVKFERLQTMEMDNVFRNRAFVGSKIVSIECCGVAKKVYCCTVPTTHTFNLACGLQVGQCSERPGTDNATCVLGSINLGILPPNMQEAKKIIHEKTARLTRMLDNVVEYEIRNNLAPIEEQKYILSELREIGIGFTDIQGYLIKYSIAYDSEDGVALIEDISREMCLAAYKASEDLGLEKGNFTAFTKEEFNSSLFVKRLKDEFPELRLDTMRNCTLISIAPNGSLALTFPTPNISSGIEPAPAFAYWKRSRSSGSWKWYFVLTSPVRKFAKDLGIDLGIDVESVEDPTGAIGETVLKKLHDLLGSKLDIFKPAHLIDPMKKVDLMARVYKYVDSAISTTYNLPSSATPELIERIYIEAYKRGIKAVAVYRDGCRQGVIEFDPPPVVEKRFGKNSETARPEKVERRCAPKRPKELPCEISHITVNGKKWVVLVGIYNGEPFEVFAGHSDDINIPAKFKTGKIVKNAGNKYSLVIPIDDNEVLEFKDMGKLFHNDEQNALTRQISLNMRTGTHLQFIVEQLKKGAGSVADFSSAISRVLGKFAREVVDRAGNAKCPSCGNEDLDRSSGCIKCPECGWSRCE